MSRAFMFEKDGMFHCFAKDKDCPHANLRGSCELVRCKDDDATAKADEAAENNQTDSRF